ncbi:double-strand break repair helicase AddA [Candidatus Liberibacter brunswickensis]
MIHHNSFQDNFETTNLISQTKSKQLLASDPTSSAWVSANAGSGKTHILVQRILRLLLANSHPSTLLCLTHTKAAAAEMSHRVLEIITEWSHLSTEILSAEITKIQGKKSTKKDISKARSLLTKILETPGGLKVQTIHAFCESIMQQFPLEANITSNFSIIDDDQSKKLIAEAQKSMLSSIMLDNNIELKKAFYKIIEISNETDLETLMSDIISNRNALKQFSCFAKNHGGEEQLLKKRFGLSSNESYELIYKDLLILPCSQENYVQEYLQLLIETEEYEISDQIRNLKKSSKNQCIEEYFNILSYFFLTKKGSPKKNIISKEIAKKAPYLKEKLQESQEKFLEIKDRFNTYKIFKSTLASLTLAKHIHSHYEELKKKNYVLDFEDLIIYTNDLLKKRDVSAWIRYKIDQEINHILIDEVQDTSLIQWEVIRSLTEDFFSGKNQNTRTLFAVGDEKQSIYSFHGAETHRVSREKKINKKRATDAGQKFSIIELPISFRSTSDILTAVDKVFSIPDNAKGLSEDNKSTIMHRSSRIGHVGTVQLWEELISERNSENENWISYFDSTPKESSASILARRIAHTIANMIGSDTIRSNDKKRFIQEKDILVLVRKRKSTPFITFLTRFLKNDYKISVAGNDRFILTDHLAIKDLIALGHFILSQEDDLSLVSILKSPLFNFSEEEIFSICTQRGKEETVYEYIKKMANNGISKFKHIIQYINELINISQFCNPHDFFTLILVAKKGRQQFISRFGSEVIDVLSEFINFILRNEQKGCFSLQELMSELEHYPPIIKRENSTNHNEVRIMTVHAAKGLESSVVFLVDTGSAYFSHNYIKKMHIAPSFSDDPGTPMWIPKSNARNNMVSNIIEYIKKSTKEEYNRLLYVGMTRASDKLIICKYSNNNHNNNHEKKSNKRTWYDMVYDSFSGDQRVKKIKLKNSLNKDEWTAYEWSIHHPENISVETEPITKQLFEQKIIPEKLLYPIKNKINEPYILNPSMIEKNSATSLTTLLSESNTLKRGFMIHKLLQIIFKIPENERKQFITSYCKKNAKFYSVQEYKNLVLSITNLLEHPIMITAMSCDSHTEVSISGKVFFPKKDVIVSGRVDQISISKKNIFIFEYKTHHNVPEEIDSIPSNHIEQLSIYEQILKDSYPNKSLICLLIYVSKPKIFVIPQHKLNKAFAEIEIKIP